MTELDRSIDSHIGKLTEIRNHAQGQLSRGNDKILFIVPGRSFDGRKRRRLWPDGPLGEPVGHAKDGIGCMFRAQEVIDAANALIPKIAALKGGTDHA